jgi:hypothetical protein
MASAGIASFNGIIGLTVIVIITFALADLTLRLCHRLFRSLGPPFLPF